jgi:hypothetical protein
LIIFKFTGKVYIIAVNANPGKLEANAKVVFENRNIMLKDGQFRDQFTIYEPHVYIIK